MSRNNVVCLLFKNEKKSPILAMAEACYRFTPQIAVRDEEAIFLEIGRCSTLYSEENLFLRLNALARRFGCSPKIAFAADVCTALAFARYGVNQIEKLPIAALSDFALPFKEDENTRRHLVSLVDLLKKLGIDNLQDFSKLSIKSFSSRFGAKGSEIILRVHQSVNGGYIAPWPLFQMPEKISEQIDLHESAEFTPSTNLDSLLFLLKNLVDRSMARLRGRGKRASGIIVELHAGKERRKHAIEFPVAQGTALGILPVIKEKLSREFERNPLNGAVTFLRFTVSNTAPGHGAQRDLFDETENEAENWDELLARLCQKLGKENAFLAHPVDRYLPESAWTRSLEKPKRISISLDAERPARVLKKAQPLKKEADQLVHAIDGKSWRVMEWHGPERISGEWWWDPRFRGYQRDYYRVLTETGEALWVFSVPDKSGFYLHGFFD